MVATRVTLQGVEDEARDSVVVADEADKFSAAVIFMLTNEQPRLARATSALQLARTRFSPNACYAELLDFVSSMSLARSGMRGGPGVLMSLHAPLPDHSPQAETQNNHACDIEHRAYEPRAFQHRD